MTLVAPGGKTYLLPTDTRSGVCTDRWRWPTILSVFSFAAVLVSFRQTVLSMGSTWYSSRTFSYGFLVFPLFLYLVWVRRERVLALRPSPNYWGLPLLGVLAAAWLMGNLGEVRVIQELALVGMVVALIWTLLGTAVVHGLRYPLAFLFFAVPFGQSLIGPLQDFTARFALNALTLSNIPVILENRTLSLPSGVWTVAEECSGIRYLMSSVVLGLIYASVVYRSPRRRVTFLLASIAVPIVANGLRAYGIILLAYLTDNKLARGVDHIVYGWLFFTVIQLALFVVGLRWRESYPVQSEELSSRSAGTIPNQEARFIKATSFAAICALIVIAFAPAVAGHLWARQRIADPPGPLTALVSTSWHAVPTYDTGWAPDLHRRDSEFSQTFVSGPGRVDLYLATYARGHGVELVNGDNLVSNPKTWNSVAAGFRNATIGGQNTRVRWNAIQSRSGPRMVWTWYWIGGRVTANGSEVKFLQAKARLFGKPATGAVIAIAADYGVGPSQAEAVLQDFLSQTSMSSGPTN